VRSIVEPYSEGVTPWWVEGCSAAPRRCGIPACGTPADACDVILAWFLQCSALEREAGFIVLGALLHAWAPSTLAAFAQMSASNGAAQAPGKAGSAAASRRSSYDTVRGPQLPEGGVLGLLGMALGERARLELDEKG
jgi:hypothetical protein